MSLFSDLVAETGYPASPLAGSSPSMPPPARHVSRWAVVGLTLLAASVIALVSRHGSCQAAGLATSCGPRAPAERGPVRLWRLEELGVHHYAFPGMLTAKQPVVFHVWLKAQRQAGKVLLRCATVTGLRSSSHSKTYRLGVLVRVDSQAT